MEEKKKEPLLSFSLLLTRNGDVGVVGDSQLRKTRSLFRRLQRESDGDDDQLLEGAERARRFFSFLLTQSYSLRPFYVHTFKKRAFFIVAAVLHIPVRPFVSSHRRPTASSAVRTKSPFLFSSHKRTHSHTHNPFPLTLSLSLSLPTLNSGDVAGCPRATRR